MKIAIFHPTKLYQLFSSCFTLALIKDHKINEEMQSHDIFMLTDNYTTNGTQSIATIVNPCCSISAAMLAKKAVMKSSDN